MVGNIVLQAFQLIALQLLDCSHWVNCRSDSWEIFVLLDLYCDHISYVLTLTFVVWSHNARSSCMGVALHFTFKNFPRIGHPFIGLVGTLQCAHIVVLTSLCAHVELVGLWRVLTLVGCVVCSQWVGRQFCVITSLCDHIDLSDFAVWSRRYVSTLNLSDFAVCSHRYVLTLSCRTLVCAHIDVVLTLVCAHIGGVLTLGRYVLCLCVDSVWLWHWSFDKNRWPSCGMA